MHEKMCFLSKFPFHVIIYFFFILIKYIYLLLKSWFSYKNYHDLYQVILNQEIKITSQLKGKFALIKLYYYI